MGVIGVITDDAVGERMAGPAIRAWHIADVLSRDGHDVTLVSTLRAAGSAAGFAIRYADGPELAELARTFDVLITQGFTLKFRPYLIGCGARLVCDLYDPIHLEILTGEQGHGPQWQARRLAAGLDALRVQMLAGDFFLCASSKQRDLWLGYLSGLGRVNVETFTQDPSLRSLIDIAPFGLPDTPPTADGPARLRGVVEGIGPEDCILLWAGGVYNWFDPVTLVDAVADLAEEFRNLRLVFLGTKHPSLDDLSTTMLQAARQRASDRAVLDTSVFFLSGWVPYADRGGYLAEADIGVSTHFDHVETAFSFRTRMLDYLWAGLPIVCTAGDEFATLVAEHQLGAVVAEQDRAGLRTAIATLVGDRAQRAAAAAQVRTVAPRFYWEVALAPLVAYCRQPYQAADLAAGSLATGRLAALGRQADERLAHVTEYVEVNGLSRLLWRIAVRIVSLPVASARRVINRLRGNR